ncbi:Uu.00g040260.m01.CDS01 [Anthostomella pinea]|uniref:Restriction of telomere capping protein 4 n=1 Tax=Anthostomella pinea TaxID=933095 RepID=A0AAI8V576_9PEZI|nr:Uu.00g040260.m01.CDS01 [Anthostomella pinea]
MSSTIKLEDDPSINAAPLSSTDDEEEDRENRPLFRPAKHDPIDSDSDDAPPRGNIRGTVFQTGRNSQASNTRKGEQEKSKPASGRKTRSDTQAEEPASSAGSKRSADEALGQMDSHLKDEFGFTNKSKGKRARTVGYGSQPRSSQPRSSQKSTQRSSAPRPDSTKGSRKKTFVRHEDSDQDPSLSQSPAKTAFKNVDSFTSDMEDGRSPRKAAFRGVPGSSPMSSPEKPKFKPSSARWDDSPGKPTPRMKKYGSEDEDANFNGLRPSRPTRANKSRAAKARNHVESSESRVEKFSQTPVFKKLDFDELDDLADDGAKDLVASHIEAQTNAGEEDDFEDSQLVTEAFCPMCHQVVDRELLEKHSDHGRMNIKKQAAFCRLHKRKAAMSSGTDKGYPEIDWDTMADRCSRHQDFLRSILEGTQSSYYRDVLKEKVHSGKNRTLLKTDDSLIPGYYGPRGLRIMTEYIMRTLSSVVRKRAVEDRLVSARGYTGYVQAVLVPELTVRLIMEDMSVTELAARQTMQDSVEVGELLYEDAEDVITNLSEDENSED